MPSALSAAFVFFYNTVGLTGFALTAASYVTAAVITAAPFLISAGVSLLLGPTAPGVKPSDAQQEVKEPLAPRRKSYGRVKVSGARWWLDTDPDSDKKLYTGLAINHGRIGGFVAYYIDDKVVEIDGSGNVTTSPYSAVNTALYTRLGMPTETAYSQLSSIFDEGNMRGDGVATILGLFENRSTPTNQLRMYPNGLPQIRVLIDASVCFDPRNPAHDVEDESTWESSDNIGVHILNYVIDPDGFGMPWARIEPNLDEWIAQMNICDEQVDLSGGGTISRYLGAGTFQLNEYPKDVIARMLAACDGRLWQRRDGSIGFSVGKFVTPTVTIESKDILSYRMERGQDRLTAIAGLRAQYMSPDFDYREHEAEPWPSGAAVVDLDEDRVNAMDLLWAPSRSQARRLMKREYIRQTANWRGTISTNLAGLRAMDERFITLVIDELGISETFEVGRFTLDPSNLRCQMELLAVPASIDDWDPSEEGDDDLEGGGPTTVAFFASSTSTASSIAWPADIQEGDAAFLFDCALQGSTVVPAGFTNFANENFTFGDFSSQRYMASRKILDGTESGSITGMNGTENYKIMLVFRGDVPISAIAASMLNVEITAGNPGAQDVLASTADVPCIVFGYDYREDGAGALTATPAFDAVVTNTRAAVGYKIYNSAPANFNIDGGDGGARNVLASGLLEIS